ncbi:MAG TPA: sigma-70 family RNA polymerase sigma factor [candidate division Zixibacteria bacterium]|nr:sigma-70 family RNA polymerase sigma factor [candidate division Zixibacteria bacterium]
MAVQPDYRQEIAAVLEGTVNAFEVIVNDHKRLVASIVGRMVRLDQDREDICQDVFVKVYQSLGRFKFGAKLSTWIARIAYNTCLNHLEKHQVPLLGDSANEDETCDSFADEKSSVDRQFEESELGKILIEEIASLPAQYRVIVTLYHLEEMSYGEIADVTCLPDGTVKSHLFRARKLLKDRLMAKYSQEDLCR